MVYHHGIAPPAAAGLASMVHIAGYPAMLCFTRAHRVPSFRDVKKNKKE